MKDSLLEMISLLSIVLGLVICFFFVFDYTPVDSFFLEKDDDNTFLDGFVLTKRITDNYSLISVSACKKFDAYYEGNLETEVNESIHIQGSFTDNFFIIEEYY
ncbi:MAG: hypothetical protein ACP5N2_04160 [Candidatus Nanoarchaeia archaeon]